jgi:hypothetical protein
MWLKISSPDNRCDRGRASRSLWNWPEDRLLPECIALAEARGTTAIPDEGFMNDVAGGIADRTKPWKPPFWE